MEPKKTGKRIVSKGEYVGRLSKRAGVGSFGIALCVFGAFLGLFVCLGYLWGDSDLSDVLIGGAVSLIAGYLGHWIFKGARWIDPGIPFTRANVTDLPAEDSLVRASEEPTPEQQAVLLRAASQGQVPPAEKLLRATRGRKP